MDEDVTMNEDYHKGEIEKGLFETLKHSPNFVKAFRQLLINHLEMLRFSNE